jgi:peptidoglycan/LPS O-acetylase OafA/YrhL
MNWRAIKKEDTTFYKGMAILMIVTHNFMHLFPNPKENQFDYHAQRVLDFLQLSYAEPENIIRFSLSFLGHYGVQVFVFLSAYGLMVKYLTEKPQYWLFMWHRWIKIVPIFLLAILLWMLLEGWVVGGHGILGPVKILYWNLEPLILKALLISNLIPDYSMQPIGPWWFVPFIFQFYLIFPMLRYLINRFGNICLLVLSVASIAVAIKTQGKIGGLNIYFTVLGHLPVFCLGMYLAQKRELNFRTPWLLTATAIIVFILGNFNQSWWHLNQVAFLIVLLAIFAAIQPHLQKSGIVSRGLLFYGSISMPLFLVNGFTREPFISMAIEHDHWLLNLLFCLASLLFSTVVACILSRAATLIISGINSESPQTFFSQVGRKLNIGNIARAN